MFRFPKLFSNYTEWLDGQQTSILSAAVIITVANGFSSLSGLLRQRLMISLFFDNPASQQAYEAFLVAFQIPDTMFQLIILGALSATFIPIFTSRRQENKEAAFEMAAAMMNTLLLIFLGLGLVVGVFAEPITRWRTGAEFTPEQVMIAANLTRLMIIGQAFFAISNFLSGMLQSSRRFVLPAIAPLLYNLGIVLGAYFLAPVLGVYGAGVGVILGAFLHMLVQLPTSYRLGFRFRLKFLWHDDSVRQLFKLMPARTAALGMNEIQKLAVGFFATSLGNLSYVIFNLATTLMTLPIRFFGVPIGQAALPFLSNESKENDLKSFRDLLLTSLHQIAFFAFPASVLLLILRIPIVRLVYGTANFPWPATVMTGRVVAILALSVAAQAAVQILIRAFHALKDTHTPFWISLITLLLNVGLSAVGIFVLDWGILSLAVSTSFTMILEMVLFVFLLDKKIGGFWSTQFWWPILKMMLASFLMAVFLYLPFRILDLLVFDTTRTMELIALTMTTSTIGMLVYLYFAALFDVRELYIIQMAWDKIGEWRKTLSRSQEVLVETPGEDPTV
jgi:putative peptidoglycan lipid II flippase